MSRGRGDIIHFENRRQQLEFREAVIEMFGVYSGSGYRHIQQNAILCLQKMLQSSISAEAVKL